MVGESSATGPRFVGDIQPDRTIDCNVAISHQQLKDLIICPRQPGEYYFVGGKALYKAASDGPDASFTYEHAHLDFVPNCIGFGHDYIAVGGPKSELSLFPLRLDTRDSAVMTARLPYPASINNSLFVSHSSQLAPPSTVISGQTRPAWGGSHGLRIGVSNNDGTVRVLGAEPNERSRLEGAGLRARKKSELNLVGEVEIPVSVNHTSLSPDGRTLLSVGDSPKVYLHQVSNSGEAFRPIAVYTASQDAGFSTAWSRDGRRFAVASQDGKVSVWDHRSSHKLATLTTDPLPKSFFSEISNPSSTRGANLLASQYSFLSNSPQQYANAARVVKFSPDPHRPGAPELIAFTDEFTSVYLADGLSPDDREKDVLTIPTSHGSLAHRAEHAMSVVIGGQNGQMIGQQKMSVGTTGCGFSPCGQYVFAGTESSICEWRLKDSVAGNGGWAEPQGGIL